MYVIQHLDGTVISDSYFAELGKAFAFVSSHKPNKLVLLLR